MMPWDLKYWLEDTADDVNKGSKPGFDIDIGWGQINAGTAMRVDWLTKSFPANSGKLISIPGWPVSGGGGTSVTDRAQDINLLFPNANAQVRWFDPILDNYRDYFDPATPRFGAGRGYFVRLNNATQSSFPSALPFWRGNSSHPASIHLNRGWNLIGTPGAQSIEWRYSQVQVRGASSDPARYGTAVQTTIGQGFANDFVSPSLYRYDAASVRNVLMQEGERLQPYVGYWIRAFQECELLFQSPTSRAPYTTAPTTMQWPARYLDHWTGQADPDGWSAYGGAHPAGLMVFGPYTTQVPVGANTVTFQTMVNYTAPDPRPVLHFEVMDKEDGTILAERGVYQEQFANAFTFQNIPLSFNMPAARAGHRMEFRVWWNNQYQGAYAKIGNIVLTSY